MLVHEFIFVALAHEALLPYFAQEQTRPEFRGEFIASSVDGSLELFYPWHKRVLRLLISGSVIFTLVRSLWCCVLTDNRVL